jgi:hypothetical protein
MLLAKGLGVTRRFLRLEMWMENGQRSANGVSVHVGVPPTTPPTATD